MNNNAPVLVKTTPFDVVVVASSLGGITALKTLLSHLPVDLPVPIVVVQHLSADSPRMLVNMLMKAVALNVCWARQGDRLTAGNIYVAPPATHTVIDPNQRLALIGSPLVNFVRPAADILFNSAAEVFRNRSIGVILTGKGADGAVGALKIKRNAGRILVQDPATCTAPEMPIATLIRLDVDFILPLEQLSKALIELCMTQAVDGRFKTSSACNPHVPTPRSVNPLI